MDIRDSQSETSTDTTNSKSGPNSPALCNTRRKKAITEPKPEADFAVLYNARGDSVTYNSSGRYKSLATTEDVYPTAEVNATSLFNIVYEEAIAHREASLKNEETKKANQAVFFPLPSTDYNCFAKVKGEIVYGFAVNGMYYVNNIPVSMNRAQCKEKNSARTIVISSDTIIHAPLCTIKEAPTLKKKCHVRGSSEALNQLSIKKFQTSPDSKTILQIIPKNSTVFITNKRITCYVPSSVITPDMDCMAIIPHPNGTFRLK